MSDLPLNAILGEGEAASGVRRGSAMAAHLAAEKRGSPIEARERGRDRKGGQGLATYLAMESRGSPIEARELGRDVNGPAGEPAAAAEADAYPRDLDEQHVRLVEWFEEAERASVDEREEAEKCRQYTNGTQWTAEEVAALRKRGQPVITINKIKDKVSLLCGMERKQRTDPRAFARTPKEEERANAATQALMFIGDDTNFPLTRSSVYDELLVEGFGGAEVGLEDDGKGGVNITITHVPYDRIWHDPHSRASDFSDARFLGLVLWMDKDQLLDLYPDAEDVTAESFASRSGAYDDRPGAINWTDSKRERVRVVQCHWTEAGEWWSATFSRAGFLAPPQQSVMVDRKGRSACPLNLQSAYVDRDNRRFGMVRDLISLQDELNKRRSKALHLLSVNRTIAEAGAVDDEDHARREAAKPDGWITVNPGLKLEIMPGGDLAMGQFKLLEHATAEMQAKGPNAAMSGTDSRDQSGRAILAQQAGGAAANEPLADALRQWSRRIYEMAWMAARQYWQEERFLRITDDMDETKWLAINRKVTLQEELAAMPPDQMAMTMQQMQMQPNDPRLQQVVRVENEINDLDVDIVIEEGQDVPALAAEEFQAMMQLAGSQPGIFPPDVLIAASSLRNKADLLERMKKAQEGQGQGQQEQAALAKAAAEADVAVKKSVVGLNLAKTNDLQHSAIAKVAAVHKQAAESFAIPDVGPMDHPQQLPTPPAPGGPPQ